MESFGKHILVDYRDCSAERLDDVVWVEEIMREAARKANATIIQSSFHHFSPQGISGVIIIQESHLTIHIWPEFRYVAVDIFTCGEKMNPWEAHQHLEKALEAGYSEIRDIPRGRKVKISEKP
ncbi:MAG: adenosylmethionine decarboxylase [Bacteroidia bacterium]|nr:adenosylmethionine decarboxylase [Bacteroidia bacterium]